MASSNNQTPEEASAESFNPRSEQVQRAQWLRAAILGTSDWFISTASLLLGVGAVKEDRWSMILSGIAGAIAGACSMAVGEFVSVSTQRDIEKTALRQRNSFNSEKGKRLDVGERSNLTISIELTPSRAIPCDQPEEKATARKITAIEIKQNDDQVDEALPSPQKAASASALAFFGWLTCAFDLNHYPPACFK